MRTRRGNTRAENSRNIVISDEDAKVIKETYNSGSTTLAKLAREYHVSRSCIHYIVRPELFNHKRKETEQTEDIEKMSEQRRDVMIKLAKAGSLDNVSKAAFKSLHTQYLEKILEARLVMKNQGVQALNRWLDTEPSFVENDLNLSNIGYIIGVTRERIRQIESSALKKLKHPRISKKLRDYNNISKPFSY